MVHSVSVLDGTVFAAHQSQLVKAVSGKVDQSVNLDLRKIGVANGEHLVGLLADTKDVVVLNPKNLEVIARHTFPKRPSAWTVSGEWLIVSDKFGDVFKAKLLTAAPQEETSVDGFNSAILGHVSMVLALAATETRVFSSDRDEHIRVSEFPNSYIIDKFLFGHESFVSQLVLDGKHLVSCGGDNYAILWDWEAGNELGRVQLPAPGCISAVISGSKLHLALEDSSTIVSVDFPSLTNPTETDVGSKVFGMAAEGTNLYVATENSVLCNGKPILSLESCSDYAVVSETNFRKR